jgi:hypothetical protein
LLKGVEEIQANSLETRKQREFDDLQNEMAGREVGRQKRFVPDDERSPEAQEKKAREEALTRLQLLMSNPEYAKAYQETFDLLRNAEAATEIALQKAALASIQARENLNQVHDKAQRLTNGTRVFRDAQGNVRDETGRLIEGTDAEQIVWRSDAPSYEQFLAGKDALEKAQRDEEEIRRYQIEVLGPSRDRIEDEDNPPSREEIDGIKRGIGEKMPDLVRAERPATTPVEARTAIAPAIPVL